jgi:hypothetical protein
VDPVPSVGLTEVEALAEAAKGSVEAALKPVDWADDVFDEVSDLIASIAVDAAPRANSMAELQQVPHSAA